MSTDTKIRLPLWVSHRRVTEVIAKIIGVEFEKSTHDSRFFDPDRPSTKQNSWSYRFVSDENHPTYMSMQANEHIPSMLNLEFQGVGGESHQWCFFHETEYEDQKLLNPNSSVTAIAIGIRLVQFFGGNLEFKDYNDKVDLKVINSKAIFPKKTKLQTSDDRWYQFQNALDAEPLLTLKEMLYAAKHAAYHTARDDAFMEALKVVEAKTHLEKTLPSASNSKAAPRL